MSLPRIGRARTGTAIAVPVALAMGLAVAWSDAPAEGAVRRLDCVSAQVCDAAGECEPDSLPIAFRLEPTETAADGSGRYTMVYGDTRAAMQALSDIGPFHWTAGSERHTLVASSETQFLWHRLVIEPAPAATVRFLICAFGQ